MSEEKGKYMETGELGFCPVCRTISEVVVLPDDRLQARIAKLMERLAYSNRPESVTADMVVRDCFDRIREIVKMPYGRSVKEMLVSMQIWLALAAEMQGEVIDEDIDLMRLAVERLELDHG